MRTVGLLVSLLLLNVGLAAAAGLPEVIQQALNNNTHIKKAVADFKIAKAIVEKTYAMFDLKLDGGMNYSESLSEATSALAPEGTQVLAYNLSLSEMLPTAGFLSLDFSSARTGLTYADTGGAGSPGLDLRMFTSSVNPTYQPELSLSYTQPLLKDFLGRPDQVALKIGAISIDLSKTSVLNTVQDQVDKLVAAYYFIAMTTKILVVQRVALTESEQYYAQTLRMQRIGLRENKDVLQTKAAMLSARAEITPAENNVKTAKDNFLSLAGFTAAQWEGLQLTTAEEPKDIEVAAELTPERETRLVDQQPAVKISKLSLEMARLSKTIADNAAWPSLNLFGKYGIVGSDGTAGGGFSEMFSNEYNNFALGVNFTMYLPNRSSTGEITTKNNELEKAQESYVELRKIIRLQIRMAQRTLVAAKQDYQLKVEARELYEKTLTIQNRHFSQGRITTRELLMAQSDFHRAQFSEISSYFEFIKALNTWRKLTGKYNNYSQAFIKE